MSGLKRNRIIFYEIFLYMCAFFLLLEWIYPLNEIAEIRDLPVFILFTFLCFLISVFRIHWVLSFGLKGIASIFVIYEAYYREAFGLIEWIPEFIQELILDINLFFSGEWHHLTPLFRIFLIVLLIWLMSYLLHYWFVIMKRILFFLILTITYVAVLHTFLPYNADVAMIRVILLAIVSLALANAFRIIDTEAIHLPRQKQLIGMYASIILTSMLALLIGLMTPVFPPQWQDPVPFMKEWSDKARGVNGNAIQKVGYGEDDSKLGGSFVQDYEPVFTVLSRHAQYWRIESKEVYTGKGWQVKEDREGDIRQKGQYLDIYFPKDYPEVDYEEMLASISYEPRTTLDKLVYPYQVEEVKSSGDLSFKVNDTTGLVQILTKQGKEPLNYTAHYQAPSYSVNVLKKDTVGYFKEKGIGDYTQVPEQLPTRIHDLAKEITEPYDNMYDKVRAVEQYFSKNGFTYDTNDVPVPEGDQDYVDQFLFDTKVGYCDNYSTSMVVMLRTLGIDTRWVKGFTSGEQIGQDTVGGDMYNIYQVTNANAHSWVEVYFPSSGWVPFEPTQGFSNLADFHQQAERRAIGEEQETTEKSAPEEEKQEQKEPEQKKEEATEQNNSSFFSNKMIITFICIIIFIGAVAIVLYVYRWKIRTSFVRKQLAQADSFIAFEAAYKHLLDLLEHRNVGKQDSETLRVFANRVDVLYKTDKMTTITIIYEELVYGSGSFLGIDKQFRNLWEELIKRISS